MVGFTAPNRYQPRAKWRDRLDRWVQLPPPNAGSWQVDITLYWRWTTLLGMSLMDAWTQLRMHPNNAASSLHPASADAGLVPPELFSRILARSRAMVIDPYDNVDYVIIDPEPTMATAAKSEGTGLEATAISVEMDPRLQRLIARRRRGLRLAATTSSGVDEVPVIAKVTSPTDWAATSEVRSSVVIGGIDETDGTTIVTGRIPIQRIEHVRKLPFVKSLKAAQSLRPALNSGVMETNARPNRLPSAASGDGGRGVVVGVVDYGCDFAHENFRTADGTRLLAIWHQDGTITAQSPNGYGREYTPVEINGALPAADPYAALGYGPDPDTPFSPPGSHGTHVLDISAGNGAGSGVAGFAPHADLVFVDVSHADIPFTGPAVVGSSFGDSTRLLEALQYIFEKAEKRPCVINVSLGTNGGPHDGTTLVEQGIDRLLSAAPNRAVTIAASNSYDDGIHAQGRVATGQTVDLRWNLAGGAQGHAELEIWYGGADQISVELLTPSHRSLGVLAPGQNGTETNSNGDVTVFAANRLGDPNNGDNLINIFLERGAEAGDWTVRLLGQNISADGGVFHAWIERDDGSQSSFGLPHDNTHTIGSISCGRLALSVGSYDAHKPELPISWFSSAGPTRKGMEKPEISAPGHAVLAAHSRTKTGVTPKSGTSMAAPAVAGIIALMLSEAANRGHALSAEDIRRIVIASARRNPPAGVAWHNRFGHGRIDAAAAVAEVIRRATNAAHAA